MRSEKALFLSERRSRISNRTVEYVVNKQLQLAGLDTRKYSVHKLRHTAATIVYKESKGDVLLVKEFLGHSSVSTTEIYTHIEDEAVRKLVDSNPLNIERVDHNAI